MKSKSALVICSGGLDSTCALYWARKRYKRIGALTFAYGQNHARMENKAVADICRAAGIELTKVCLPIGKYFTSSLLGGKIPDGSYSQKNMSSTIVPFRNGIMLAFAAGLAESKGFDEIILGNHSGDHFIYPDCRPSFIEGIRMAIKAGTQNGIVVRSPFCYDSKADIVRRGFKLGVPFGKTYSCYKGGKRHCGKCGTCTERKQAFKIAGVKDPTEYEN